MRANKGVLVKLFSRVVNNHRVKSVNKSKNKLGWYHGFSFLAISLGASFNRRKDGVRKKRPSNIYRVW